MAFTSAMFSVRPRADPTSLPAPANRATGFPDPFAVATINGEQTQTTAVSKRTLCPYWNESFDLCDNPESMAAGILANATTAE